jgi:hypothetical protein
LTDVKNGGYTFRLCLDNRKILRQSRAAERAAERAADAANSAPYTPDSTAARKYFIVE